MAGDITFKFPLKKYSRGFPESYRTMEGATKENLKNLILTNKGERVINPDIGTNITQIFGEMFGNIEKDEMQKRMESDIKSAVEKYLPSIDITSVKLKDRYDDETIGLNELVVSVNYVITSGFGFADNLVLRIS